MTLANHVDVAITRISAGVTQQGFSTPLVLAYHTRWTSEYVRSYGSVQELEADGFTSDDITHKLVSAIFAQPNPPSVVKVGRRLNAPTQTVRITPEAVNNTRYALTIGGLVASYTSDGSATVAEVVAGLVAAANALADVDAIIATGASSASSQTLSGASLDGVSGYRALSPSRRLTFTFSSSADWDATTITVTGKDARGATITETFAVPNNGASTVTGSKLFARVTSVAIPAQSGAGGTFTMGVAAPMTAADNSTYLTLTSPAGLITSIEPTAGDLIVDDRTADPGISADISNVRGEDDDFYALLLDSNSRAEILAAAAIIEAAAPKKILVAQSADTGCLSSDSITDVMWLAQNSNYDRTAIMFHPYLAGAWPAAAWVGNALAYGPGTVNWKGRELAGVTAYALGSAERSAVLAKKGNLIERVAGRTITSEGTMAGGEWIDVVHGLDWIEQRIAERVFGALIADPSRKVAFTDAGIQTVVAELRAQLQEGEDVGVLAPGWTITAPRAASISSAQKATRQLPNVRFNAGLAGAINTTQIRGTVAA